MSRRAHNHLSCSEAVRNHLFMTFGNPTRHIVTSPLHCTNGPRSPVYSNQVGHQTSDVRF